VDDDRLILAKATRGDKLQDNSLELPGVGGRRHFLRTVTTAIALTSLRLVFPNYALVP
jgi:hypothetical protein